LGRFGGASTANAGNWGRGCIMFDLDNEFYRPLWIRLLITIGCVGWGLVELATGNLFWAALFGGIGLYSGYKFSVTFNPKSPE
jgi:hypothetical protein